MSKALVIKGASFAQNAIEQITLIESIPCTGITLDQSTLALTSIGATATLTATVTPSNTTETITWVSSDNNVVAVTGGVVTCTGLGSATITAYCGEYSATCSVTASMTVNADSAYTFLNGYAAGGTDLTSNPVKDYVTATTDARGRIYYSAEDQIDSAYNAYGNNNLTTYPIPLPTGVTHISIPKVTNVGYIRLCALNSQERQTPTLTTASDKVVAHVYALTGAVSAELDIPENADSFVFGIYAVSGKTATDITDPITVMFT